MTTTNRFTGIEDCNCLALRRAARTLSRTYDETISTSGLRAAQYSILVALSHHDGVSINEFAEMLCLDRTTTGKNLRPLERAGYISVAPSATDGRVREAHLTEAGRAAIAIARPLWKKAQEKFEADNGADFARNLRQVLADLKT